MTVIKLDATQSQLYTDRQLLATNPRINDSHIKQKKERTSVGRFESKIEWITVSMFPKMAVSITVKTCLTDFNFRLPNENQSYCGGHTHITHTHTPK